ncbi:MAG: fused MFS/spermidine synthase [Kiritimatiellia bacterium]
MPVQLTLLAIFFGSFLLFGIQPMLGRTLLPSFGGTASVWTVCLAAYQILLLAGYGYAHFISTKGAKTQRKMHIILLAVSVIWTTIFAATRILFKHRLGNLGLPSLEVLLCVMIFAGLPYVLLSANSTLIQSWLSKSGSKAFKGREIYKLYAVSNVGSLLGLLIYPFLIEPFLSLSAQWYGFTACLLVYTVFMGLIAKATRPKQETPEVITEAAPLHHEAKLPTMLTKPWLWFVLPGISTFLLNAVTTHLTNDITPIPLLWVLLLAAFLLSYVVGFSNIGEKGLIGWTIMAALVLTASAFIGCTSQYIGDKFIALLGAGVLLVFSGCTFLHSWLYRIRPEASKLTLFYLGIATGGAIGGSCASLVAPMIFNDILEYPVIMVVCAALGIFLIKIWDHRELGAINMVIMLFFGAAILFSGFQLIKRDVKTVLRMRNFYGSLNVEKNEAPIRENGGRPAVYYEFKYGETTHGMQFEDPELAELTTCYFSAIAGGAAFMAHPSYTNGTPMQVGIVGLGIGVLANYGREGDIYRMYDINPQVVEIACNTNYFTYISNCKAKVEIVTCDARKALEAERANQEPKFDVLIVDVYSGDSLPAHISTKEAYQLFKDRLKPDGTLAIHMTNWHFDISPLCKVMAKELNMNLRAIIAPAVNEYTALSNWAFMRNDEVELLPSAAREYDFSKVRDISPPSDEKGSILTLIDYHFVPPLL